MNEYEKAERRFDWWRRSGLTLGVLACVVSLAGSVVGSPILTGVAVGLLAWFVISMTVALGYAFRAGRVSEGLARADTTGQTTGKGD